MYSVWQLMGDHPVMTVIVFFIMFGSMVDIARALAKRKPKSEAKP